MLDVHAPEHRIGGKRDFFVHLFTITIGLLIALGLEQGVEAIHHHHQREKAEAEIRREIELNLGTLNEEQQRIAAEMKDMVAVIAYVNARLSGQNPEIKGLSMQLSESPMKDSAWRTAMNTGVVQYMDYDKAENFSECYKELGGVETMQLRLMQSYLDIEGFVAIKKPNELSPEELHEALPGLRSALSNLGGSRDIDHGMADACQAALK